MHFSYLYLAVHTLLVIDKHSDAMAVNISINRNVSGLVGRNDTHLTCSFTKEVDQVILNAAIVARNEDGSFHKDKPIVIFPKEKAANVLPFGEYLSERVTITNMTEMSTNVTMTFNRLNCEDEKDYICTFTYSSKFGVVSTKESEQSRILVKASSSKPDVISSLIVYPTKSEKQENTSSTFLREGDTVMFICTGNIGKPPGKFIWQMYSPQHDQLIIYSNATTVKEEIPENCTFRGTSNLTVHISPDHFKAKYRCFEESKTDVIGLYVETEPLNVHFSVRHIDIKIQPNQTQYNKKIDKITLTCNGSGNPEPNYTWFKEDNKRNILSLTNLYIIDDVILNNSGVYTCEAYNMIDNVYYKNSTSVEIDIVDELLSSPDSALLKIFLVYVIPVICAIIFIVTCVAVIKRCCIRPKRKEKEERYCRKLSYDGIIINPEYTSVIYANNTSERETGDTLVFNNGMEGHKNKSRNKQEDLIKTVDVNTNLQTTSFHTPVYAVPSDALQAKNVSSKIPPGMSSFKDVENI